MSATRYFAYGSNLASSRLRGRVPSATVVGVARADGFALRLDKQGADGTAKANLHPAPGSHVFGVVYALDPREWPLLDACEPDYERIAISVSLGGRAARALTYRSDRLAPSPVAAAWYKRLIVAGAREHGLPAAWCAALEALPTS